MYGVFSYTFRVLLAAGGAGFALVVLRLSAEGFSWHIISLVGICFPAHDHAGLRVGHELERQWPDWPVVAIAGDWSAA